MRRAVLLLCLRGVAALGEECRANTDCAATEGAWCGSPAGGGGDSCQAAPCDCRRSKQKTCDLNYAGEWLGVDGCSKAEEPKECQANTDCAATEGAWCGSPAGGGGDSCQAAPCDCRRSRQKTCDLSYAGEWLGVDGCSNDQGAGGNAAKDAAACAQNKAREACCGAEGCGWGSFGGYESCTLASSAQYSEDSSVVCDGTEVDPIGQKNAACRGNTEREACCGAEGCGWGSFGGYESCTLTSSAQYSEDSSVVCDGTEVDPIGEKNAACRGNTEREACCGAEGCGWGSFGGYESCTLASSATHSEDSSVVCSADGSAQPSVAPAPSASAQEEELDVPSLAKSARTTTTDGAVGLAIFLACRFIFD